VKGILIEAAEVAVIIVLCVLTRRGLL